MNNNLGNIRNNIDCTNIFKNIYGIVNVKVSTNVYRSSLIFNQDINKHIYYIFKYNYAIKHEIKKPINKFIKGLI